MKKLTLTFLAIITLLTSCNSDEPEGNPTGNLTRIDRVFNNTGNTATINFDGDKITSYYYNETILKNEFIYNSDNQMTSFRVLDYQGEAKTSYDFSYDSNGRLTAVHDFKSNPFFNYEPEHQDRIATWNGNTMSLPLLVDNEADRYDNYEFTFNNDDLLTKYKVTKWNGNVEYNVDFGYDNNKNATSMSGLFDGGAIDLQLTYDNKTNPRYPHFNKYYINNILIGGGRKDSGFLNPALFNLIYKYGKNNPLKQDATNTNSNVLFYSYDYEGNLPTKSYYGITGTTVTTSTFVYDN